MIEKGKIYESRFVVKAEDTAANVGSGELPVLATPILVAWMENVAMLTVAKDLSDNETTVEGMISVSHLRPSSIGTTVEISAILTDVNGKKLTFSLQAKDSASIIAEGEHIRFIVDKERFMSKLK